MVSTRSQARHTDVDEAQPPCRAALQALLQDTARALGPDGAERLGRGCRVHRPVVSLEDEYLQTLVGPGRHSGASTRRPPHEPEELVINTRYPPREAAQRALDSLQATLKGGSEEDEPPVNVRHHTAMGENVRRKKTRNWRHTVSVSSSSSATDAVGSSATSETGFSSSEDDGSGDHATERNRKVSKPSSDRQSRPARPPARTAATGFATSTAGGGAGTGSGWGADRKRGRDSSIDSSISNISLRDESIDELTRLDAGVEVVDSSVDGSEDMATEKEMRRAMHHAKESTVKNVSINYYMQHAMGEEDPKRATKRKLDRRYRHLFRLDEDAKAAGAAGGGCAAGTGPGGGGGANASGAFGDISPLRVDHHITFERVGGLPGHIVALREMVLLPLLYPQLLGSMGLSPPRGVLFVGPPGTGKTLLARALASEGSRVGGRPVTFFMRKGADILSKWVGESERQLDLLFTEAKRQQPSIIFFDEIDGLAPTRHTKTEQTQAALVATFLALLDGLDDRGQVVVIGATNRPDTLDPALRRPGRFDRELLFPLPDAAARRHILSILTAKRAVSDRERVLDTLVRATEGYSGADLQALCTEAGLNRLRTALPQLYATNQRLRIPTDASLILRTEDFFAAARRLAPSRQRGGGELHWIHLEEHVECLCHSVRDELLHELSQNDSTVARALLKETRDCADVMAAVRQLSSYPVPHARHALLLSLHVARHPKEGNRTTPAAADQMVLLSACMAVMRALPSFQAFMVHLPHVLVNFTDIHTTQGTAGGGAISGSASAGSPYSGSFRFGHMYDLVQSVQRSSPCMVLLRGAEEWLREQGYTPSMEQPASEAAAGGTHAPSAYSTEDIAERKRRMDALRYYLNLLADTEVLVLIPCSSTETRDAILGATPLPSGTPPTPVATAAVPVVRTTLLPNGHLHPHWKVLNATVGTHPTSADLHRFVQHIYHLTALALGVQEAMRHAASPAEALQLDPTPPPPTEPHPPRPRPAALELWRKVEYRRLQLRHVLLRWMSQFITAGKFKVLQSCDLDFGPEHPQYAAWLRHTKGCRIGLLDIMEKLESEEYVCLSQYHDDIDVLVRNVRSFFRSRSVHDQKYRLKALELKETSVLNMYKINRNVVRFCEMHRDVVEPDSPSSDDDADTASTSSTGLHREGVVEPPRAVQRIRARQVAPHSAATAAPKQRRKTRLFGQRRRRRRRLPLPVRRPQSPATEERDDEDASLQDVAEKVEAETDKSNDKIQGGVDAKQEPSSAVATPPTIESPTHPPDAAVEAWAISLLAGKSYYTLHGLYQCVMRQLEEEVRRRDAVPIEAGQSDRTDVRTVEAYFRESLQAAVGVSNKT